jgi:ABC-type multidrug transport system permease subunit
MGIMVGATFWALPQDQTSIRDRFAVIFFGVVFLSMMSIAGAPAFIEDKLVYDRETSNAMYDVLPYVFANTVVGLPFLVLIAFAYTVVFYPMSKMNSDPEAGIRFFTALLLSLECIETIVLNMSAVFPIFVITLAIMSLWNGFSMVVIGFFVSLDNLPQFWTWAHYWSYLTYPFQMMVENEFSSQTFDCTSVSTDISASGCFCSISSSLNAQCKIAGADVLSHYDYHVNYGNWAWVMLTQIILYRCIFIAILYLRRRSQLKGLK